MCLTVPRKVIKVEGDVVMLQDGRWVKSIVGPLKPGQMVLAQADLAIELVSEKQAAGMKALLVQD